MFVHDESLTDSELKSLKWGPVDRTENRNPLYMFKSKLRKLDAYINFAIKDYFEQFRI